MKRKINKAGPSTLTISLPKKWARAHNLRPGDELEIVENHHCIKFCTKESIKDEVAKIKLTKPKRLTSRSLFNLYRKGVEEIEIYFEDPLALKDIQAMLPLLMGFEMIDEEPNYVKVASIMKIDESKFDDTLKRLFYVTKILAEQSYKAIEEKEYEKLEGVAELEVIQNKYYMFLCRVINQKGKYLFEHPTLRYLLVQRLEDLADDYKYICRFVSERKKPSFSKVALKYYREVNELMYQLNNFYFEPSNEIGKVIIEGKKQLTRKGLDLLEKVDRKEVRLIFLLTNIVVKIYESASPIFGIHSEKLSEDF
jgi:phosphate uptake regulator